MGSRGAAALRAFPRLFFERVPERGIFFLPTVVTNMKGWSLIGKVTSHSEGRRRSGEVGTRLGAGVEAEGVVAELVSKLRSLVDRRRSRRG